MTTINTSDIDLTLTICGVERELLATVRYIRNRAERGSRERGSGLQLEPDYPESIEILYIKCDDRDVTQLFSEKQLDAISQEILVG